MDTLSIILAAIAAIVALPLLIWAFGAIRNRLDGADENYRSLSAPDKLAVDWLRAQGHTLRSALSTVQERPKPESWNALSDLSSEDAKLVAKRIQEDFVAGRMPPALSKLYAEAVFEQAENRTSQTDR